MVGGATGLGGATEAGDIPSGSNLAVGGTTGLGGATEAGHETW